MNTWCSLSVINQCNNPLHHPLTGRRQTSVAHAGPVCVCVCFFKHKSLFVSCRVVLVICTKRNLVENKGLSVYVCLYVKVDKRGRSFIREKEMANCSDHRSAALTSVLCGVYKLKLFSTVCRFSRPKNQTWITMSSDLSETNVRQ